MKHPITIDKAVSGLLKNKYMKVKKIGGLVGLVTSAETDTGWDIPTNAVIHDIILDVTTEESGLTIDIGTEGSGSNDPDGFADAISVNATGLVRPEAAVTVGGSETYYSANTRGALLSSYVAGTNTDGNFGLYNEKPDFSSNGEDLTYTPPNDSEDLVFDLYVIYSILAETKEEYDNLS